MPIRADKCSINRILGSSVATMHDVMCIRFSQANALVRTGAVDAAIHVYGITRLTQILVATPHGAFVH